MNKLKEKIMLIGIYVSVGVMSILCIWRVEQLSNAPKNVDNTDIVMYEK